MPGPSGKTSRRELPFPLLTDTPDNEADVKALAEALDQFAKFNRGLLAARPLIGVSKEGDIYWATDDTSYGANGTWWVAYGGAWNMFPLVTVVTAMLTNLSVTEPKVGEEAISTSKVKNLAITAAKLAAEAVETGNIKNLAVTEAKLAAALLGGAAANFALRKLGAGAEEAAPGNVVPPIGSIMDWGGAADPNTQWLICNGREVSRATYATLFTNIGTAFGAGNGTTTFNIPNFENRTAIGKSGTHALASTGGAETVALTTGQLASHTHGPEAGKELLEWPNSGEEVQGQTFTSGSGLGLFRKPILGHAATAAAGSGEAHSNMQPYLTTNKIIRVL